MRRRSSRSAASCQAVWIGCQSSSRWPLLRPLIAMSSLAFPEVASKAMVASAMQPVQHNDKLRRTLGVLVQRGWRNAICWLAPSQILAGIVSLAWPPYLSHALCKECTGSSNHYQFAGSDNKARVHSEGQLTAITQLLLLFIADIMHRFPIRA